MCDVGEHLDYENCKCKKRLVDKMVEECKEKIDEAKLAEIALPVLILPINTSSVIKKMFLYTITFIKQKIINHIKWQQ